MTMAPKGWTARDVKHRDKIAEALMRKDFSQEQAFAIATAQLLKSRKKGGKQIG
jgi:hypothetical protein